MAVILDLYVNDNTCKCIIMACIWKKTGKRMQKTHHHYLRKGQVRSLLTYVGGLGVARRGRKTGGGKIYWCRPEPPSTCPEAGDCAEVQV